MIDIQNGEEERNKSAQEERHAAARRSSCAVSTVGTLGAAGKEGQSMPQNHERPCICDVPVPRVAWAAVEAFGCPPPSFVSRVNSSRHQCPRCPRLRRKAAVELVKTRRGIRSEGPHLFGMASQLAHV
jgi:hypothetical protein